MSAVKNVWCLIDEAYTEFADRSFIERSGSKESEHCCCENFSKIYGLAGARIGYVIAHPDTIKKLAAFQPWPDANISAVTVAAASAALKDQAFVKDCKEKIAQARELCYKTF